MTQNVLKATYWELLTKSGRFGYWQYFLGQIPNSLGFYLREKVYRRHFRSLGNRVQIYPGVRFRNIQEMIVGDDVHLGVDAFFQAAGGIEIHNNVLIGPGVKIWSTNHKTDRIDIPIMEQGYADQRVVIGSDVWIAANAFIMPGVELADGCIVSAGAVVGKRKYPPFCIISGNPARVIGYRSRESAPKEETDIDVAQKAVETKLPPA